jgi:hypothetical protein
LPDSTSSPDVAIPAAIEANIAMISITSEGGLGTKTQPKRLVSQSQEPEPVSYPFQIFYGHIVDEVVIISIVADLSYYQRTHSTLSGHKAMLLDIILVMTQLTNSWLRDIESTPFFNSFHFLTHLHHLLLHIFYHFTEGRYFLFEI